MRPLSGHCCFHCALGHQPRSTTGCCQVTPQLCSRSCSVFHLCRSSHRATAARALPTVPTMVVSPGPPFPLPQAAACAAMAAQGTPPALHMGCCWPRGCHSTRHCFLVPCCSALLRCRTFCFGSWFYCSHPALCDQLACFPVTATQPQVVSTHLLLLKWVGKHPTAPHVVLLHNLTLGPEALHSCLRSC